MLFISLLGQHNFILIHLRYVWIYKQWGTTSIILVCIFTYLDIGLGSRVYATIKPEIKTCLDACKKFGIAIFVMIMFRLPADFKILKGLFPWGLQAAAEPC